MQCSLEQRMEIKFCVKLEKSAEETIPMLKKAFGVDCRNFQKNGTALDINPVTQCETIFRNIRKKVHEIVSELGVRKVCAKLVPKVLTDDQKARLPDAAPPAKFPFLFRNLPARNSSGSTGRPRFTVLSR
ncbi:hypothetical protein NQ318_012924 [Aromia moschata]|uniref:Uncharacterized protein n=1 Tax=Aromia moschata TaxID=1265417 RepID=A0AAV8XN37_9CUCU|nr:hypothetical protein NQ318_012924 [Aromia moschata]